MSKRFLDTGFLDQKWIRKLTPEKKIFLIYLMLKCDNAGIIDLDIEDAEFWIGKKIGNPLEFLPESYLILIQNSSKYFMPKFIEWQYGNLKSDKNIVKQARQILEKHSLIDNEFNLKLDNIYIKLTQELPENQVTSNSNSKDNSKGKEVEKNLKPTLEEFIQYFQENGYSKELALRAWKGYEAANWHDSQGKKIKNWKQKAQHVWFRDENKPQKQRLEVSDFDN